MSLCLIGKNNKDGKSANMQVYLVCDRVARWFSVVPSRRQALTNIGITTGAKTDKAGCAVVIGTGRTDHTKRHARARAKLMARKGPHTVPHTCFSERECWSKHLHKKSGVFKAFL